MRLPKFLSSDDGEADAEKLRLEAEMTAGKPAAPALAAVPASSPKFEPTESTNKVDVAPPAGRAPSFDPAAATAAETPNEPAVAQPLPKFAPPPEQKAGAVAAGATYATPAQPQVPMPVYDAHGAPTGQVTGGGSELARKRAAVEAEENYKPTNHNSRIAGIGLGAERGYERGGVLGALFGAVSGGVNKSADEDYAHRRRLATAEGGYERAAKREHNDQTVLNDETERATKVAKAQADLTKASSDISEKERADALKNLQQYERLDVKNPVHVAAMLRARKALWDVDPETWNAANVQTVTDQETGNQIQRVRGTDKWEPSKDVAGGAITTKGQRQDKLPESFYQLDGQDEKTIHADAVARAGVKDFSKSAEIDPAKKKLLIDQGMSEQDIKDGIQLGTIKLSELVKDSQKDEARRYEAAVAGAESGALKRHNLYRQAVDQTLTTPMTVKNEKGENVPTPVVSIAGFQQQYKVFYDDYSKLYKKDPQAAEARREQFFATLRNFRLR